MNGKRTFAITKKVLRSLRHDPRSIAMMLVAPILAMTIFGFAFGSEIEHAPIAVVDRDSGGLSDRFIAALDDEALDIERYDELSAAREDLRDAQVRAVLYFPQGFSQGVGRGNGTMELFVDGSNSNYVTHIVRELQEATRETMAQSGARSPVNIETRYAYAEDARYIDYFVPGIMTFAVMQLTTLLTLLAFVGERTSGTLTRLLATPVKGAEVVLGYALAFGIVATVQGIVLLTVALLLFDVMMVGSLMLAFLVIVLVAIDAMSLGIVLSAAAKRELQAVQMIPLIIFPTFLLSGIFVPIESLPSWLRPLSWLIPPTYGVEAMRDIMLRGWALDRVWPYLLGLVGFGVLFLTVASVRLERQRATSKKRKKGLVALGLLAVVVMLAPLAVAAPAVTSATWGTTAAPIEAAPGDTARTLTVTLLNVDDDAYASVRATLGADEGIAPAPGGGTATLSGTWAPDAVWTATFLVDVATNASRAADLPLRLEMEYASSGERLSRSLIVPVTLTGRPSLSIDAETSTLASWSRVELPLTVSNVGSGPAGGVVVRAASGNAGSLAPADDGVRFLGGLAADASEEAALTFVTGAPGPVTLTLTLSYSNAVGTAVSETRSLFLRVADAGPAPLAIELASSELRPGDDGVATYRIANEGNATARDVTVRLALPATASALAGSEEQFVGDIAAGAARDATFAIRPSAAARDALDVSLTLAWTDGAGIARSIVRRDAIPLAQASAGPLTMRLADPSVEAGRPSSLRFELANGGDEAVRDARVQFVLPASAATTPFTPTNASDSHTLGDLAAGASRTVALELLVSRAAADVYPVSAVVSWTDGAGGLRSETFRFGVIARGAVELVVSDSAGDVDDDVATIEGVVTNLGTTTARNVYLRVSEGSVIDATAAQLLGDLAPNAALAFAIDADAPGSELPASVPLNLTWNDEYGGLHTRILDVPLHPAVAAPGDDGDGAPDRGVPAAGALLALAGAAGAALFARRRR